jgi:hypothetical protein
VSLDLVLTVVQVFCTLAIFSFLYKDNPVYKFVEHLFVGVATGWWVVLEYRDVFLPNLLKPLWHGIQTGEKGETHLPWWTLFIPLALGLLLFMRLSPKATYLARWSMAVIVGTFSGLAVIGFASGDLFNQIESNIIPFFAPGSLAALGQGVTLATVLEVLRNPVLIIGCITVLVYFFFSLPHQGAVGGVATIGIWFLMVSFGASYGNTVMARISLFIGRANFLLAERTGSMPHWLLTVVFAVAIIAVIALWERGRRGQDLDAA